ncbi:unnamed protein product [Linum tenue]|uniref:Uncharacterized protein n=1 Tax=Linum tenue TaxID=586396 RepID=A0AAV0Q8V8_9ROSI|nr:unnamed protein product [Linum tenue]
MARQAAALRNRKKQPLLADKPHPKPAAATEAEMKGVDGIRGRRLDRTNAVHTRRAGEVAGGAAAECVAVCCCCPCTLMNIVVLAVYKVPAGLCRKARKRQQRLRRMKLQQSQHGLLAPTTSSSGGRSREELEREIRELVERAAAAAEDVGGAETTAEAEDLEKEMWDRFYGTGFWRSPSQREI